MSHRNRRGNAWVTGIVILGCIIVLACLLLPATRNTREAARRMSCSSNIRQFGIAVLNYEYSYKKLPGLCAGFGIPVSADTISSTMPTAGRWNSFVGLMPFMEANAIFSQMEDGLIYKSANGNDIKIGPFGQADSNKWFSPKDSDFPLVSTQVGFFRCPSDPGRVRTKDLERIIGRTNYAFNLGDSQVGQNTISINQITTRGPFMRGHQRTLAEISDGTSKTIMFGEIATPARDLTKPRNLYESKMSVQGTVYGELEPSPSEPIRGIDVVRCRSTVKAGSYVDTAQKRLHEVRGTRWLDALACYTGFTTILGPNAASCSPASDPEGDGIYSAGSYHFGGAHVVMFDNAVKFIPNEIDTQNRDTSKRDYYSPGIRFDEAAEEWQKTDNWDKPSPFGAWGAMGTIDSQDWQNESAPFPD